MKRNSAMLALACVLAVAGGCQGRKADLIPPQPQPGSTCTSPGDLTPDLSLTGHASIRVNGRSGVPDPLSLKFYRFDGPFLIDFSGREGELRICGGPPFTGSRPTSDQVAMSVAIDDGTNDVAGLSFSGECTIDMTDMTPTDAAGSFRCKEVEDNNGQFATFSATGTFSLGH